MKRRSEYSGLSLWIVENNTRYKMTIWRNFQGYTYRKSHVVADKWEYVKKVYNRAPGDYATAFVYLKSHFGLE